MLLNPYSYYIEVTNIHTEVKHFTKMTIMTIDVSRMWLGTVWSHEQTIM